MIGKILSILQNPIMVEQQQSLVVKEDNQTEKFIATTQRPDSMLQIFVKINCKAMRPFDSVFGMDIWCWTNCNFIPSFCPLSHCTCDEKNQISI